MTAPCSPNLILLVSLVIGIWKKFFKHENQPVPHPWLSKTGCAQEQEKICLDVSSQLMKYQRYDLRWGAIVQDGAVIVVATTVIKNFSRLYNWQICYICEAAARGGEKTRHCLWYIQHCASLNAATWERRVVGTHREVSPDTQIPDGTELEPCSHEMADKKIMNSRHWWCGVGNILCTKHSSGWALDWVWSWETLQIYFSTPNCWGTRWTQVKVVVVLPCLYRVWSQVISLFSGRGKKPAWHMWSAYWTSRHIHKTAMASSPVTASEDIMILIEKCVVFWYDRTSEFRTR